MASATTWRQRWPVRRLLKYGVVAAISYRLFIHVPHIPDKVLLNVKLDAPVLDSVEFDAISEYVLSQQSTDLSVLVQAIDRARTDDRVVGLVATMGPSFSISLAQAQELQGVLKRFSSSNKPTMIYTDALQNR